MIASSAKSKRANAVARLFSVGGVRSPSYFVVLACWCIYLSTCPAGAGQEIASSAKSKRAKTVARLAPVGGVRRLTEEHPLL